MEACNQRELKACEQAITGKKGMASSRTSGLFSQTGSMKLTAEHDQTTKRYTSEDLLLLNPILKTQVSSRTHNNRHMATRGSCEQQSSPGVVTHPDWAGKGVPTSAEVSPKDQPPCQEVDGNTGGCVLRRYVQLLNSLEE